MRGEQGKYWLLTVPKDEFVPMCPLHPSIEYIKGQMEIGGNTGYVHWQIVVCFVKKVRRARVKEIFGKKEEKVRELA